MVMSSEPTLTEVCSPVFLHLVSFRRNSATSGVGLEELKASLRNDLDRARSSCAEDPRLRPLFERIWYALVVTADQIVLSSQWQHRPAWSMDLLEMHYFKSSEGGKKFYHLVSEVLNDPTEQAASLAELLFTCMALGFQGELLGERGELESRRRQLFEKARLPGKLGPVLTPDSYERNKVGEVATLPTVGIMRLVLVALAAILFAVFAGNSATKWKNRNITSGIDDVRTDLEGDVR